MGKATIISIQELIYNDETIDLSKVCNCRDISFENIGSSIVTIKQKSYGNAYTINPGDPMLTLEGYDDAYRADEFEVKFIGSGEKKLSTWTTMEINCK